jgi:4'-phosphopantetheinyl transferase
MTSVGWLTRSLADVPAGDGWLSPGELDVLARLTFEKRRSDWRLGRFAAKTAVARWLGVPIRQIEILAASDGAPEVRLDGEAPVVVSISHRAERALVVVGHGGTSLGCDLELIEARSRAFVSDWLAPAEGALVERHGARRDLVANLAWTAKEAAAKMRREGLRLDVRNAVTDPDGLDEPATRWQPLAVTWADDGRRSAGWWRTEPGWVMAVVGEPTPGAPCLLKAP